MKREDSIVSEIVLGTLSEDEQTLGAQVIPGSRETLETFLYEHLMLAARARLRMDSARKWGPEYDRDYRAREIALDAASKHYRALLDLGGEIEPLLAAMILKERLTP